MISNRIKHVLNNLLNTDRGRIILSILLGLGLASLFISYCEGKNCYRFIGPEQNKLRDKIFSFDSNNSKCYSLKEENVKCGSREKTIEFA